MDPEKGRARSRRWRAANPEKRREIGRRWRGANPEYGRKGHASAARAFENRIRHKYGITTEDYAWMYHDQQGLCLICELPLDLDKPSGVNVDHEQGRRKKGEKVKVRGLLHGWCNYRYLGPVERGGEARYHNAGRYLGWTDGA